MKNVASACHHCGQPSREVWLGHGVLGHRVRAKLEETDWFLRTWQVFLLVFHFKDFFLRFYLFTRDTQREAETQAEGEAGPMPNVGLDPRSPGSGPGLKAVLNH